MLNDLEVFDGNFGNLPVTSADLQDQPPVVLVFTGAGVAERQLLMNLRQRFEGTNVVVITAEDHQAKECGRLSELMNLLPPIAEHVSLGNWLEEENKPWYRQFSKQSRKKRY